MLTPDFKEFIALLNKHNVRYLVVGGYALALHGHPRFTKDIDIWICPDNNNAESLITVLQEFGFSSLNVKKEDFLFPGYIIQLGHPPNRIDLLTSVTGLEFESCYSTRMKMNIDGIHVDFIDRESMKTNKKAVGRLQDLADLENLETG